MDKRHFDDGSPALTVQAHGNSKVHTTRISATKSAPRRIERLVLTIEIHSNWSRSGTHLSTSMNGISMMTRGHSALRLLAVRSSRRYPSPQQNLRFDGSTVSPSPHHRNSRFESLRDPPIHINKRDFDDYPPALIAQAPSNRTVRTMPVSTTKSAPRRILRLALTIKIHSDSSRSGTHLSTRINGASMMSCRHTPRSASCDSIDHALPIYTTKTAPR
ncbi:hypothetical protein FEP12_03621 [Burkholderia multivorans]|nr:hypothetical protein [Burkholderia multivorans]MDR9182846.1 hypothetical protein [Burkholderia multivorans]MDR9188567.1 hypothetical protein [Burkholderia multivorans]MDR9193646.1 hypothetical protein [Burkholderia multivorans]MDR9198440.1 hypothetical protein [Burkholderia multivorans]